jgi:hypothetical protein
VDTNSHEARVSYGFARLDIPFVREHVFAQVAESLAEDLGQPVPPSDLSLAEIWTDLADQLKPD